MARRTVVDAVARMALAGVLMVSGGCQRRVDSSSTEGPMVADSLHGRDSIASSSTAPSETTQATDSTRSGRANTADFVRVLSPRPGEAVASPLTVTGKARGPWYFEATFPLRLLDDAGRELASVPARARGEWMTPNFVPFEATLTFTKPSSETGALVLERSNPSGLPENAAEVRVPVRFR